MSTSHEFNLCPRCRTRIRGEGVSKRWRASGERADFHVGCWALIRESSTERSQRAEDARRFALSRLEHLVSDVPSWAWCMAQSQLSHAVRSERLLTLLTKWKPELGSALLLGPSGAGKTTVAAQIVRRRCDEAIEACARVASCDTAELTLAAGIVWTTGPQLIVARREHSLGAGEAPLITKAKRASLLVLDELGHESATADPSLFDVLDLRYSRAAPSIVTSGLRRTEFLGRYGDALFRRLTERGVLLDVHV